jgi:anti-sigma factor RsiW
MTVDPEHDRTAELLGVYALDAVDLDERSQVEQHLGACPRCRAELDVLRQVAADLAVMDGIEGEQPPASVWDRVAAGIADHGVRPASVPAAVVPIGGRRRTTTRTGPHRVAWIGGVAAGAAAAAIAVLAVGLVHSDGQVRQLRSALAGRGPTSAVRAALEARGHRVVDLRSSHGGRLAEVVVQRSGVGYVVSSTMTALPANETYQLWASIDGRPISLGLLGRKPAPGEAFSLGASVASARELLVTVEPAGGVPSPDRTPVATAPLAPA